MMRAHGWSGSVAALRTPARQASAVEALSAAAVVEHREIFPDESDAEDGDSFVRYTHGFLNGAVATEERVRSELADEPVPLTAVVDPVDADIMNPAQVIAPQRARDLVYVTQRRECSCTVNPTK